MKKFVLSLFILPFVAIQAQTFEPLPDGSFEKWTTGTTERGESYDDLADPFWTTLNLLSTLPEEMSTGPVTTFKIQGKNGLAPMAKSDTLRVGEDLLFLPGVFGAFTLDITNKTAHFGRSYTSRPDSLVGYMKYLPVAGDSASIFVELYRRIQGTKVIIGRVEQKFYSEISDWNRFSLPIKYVITDEDDDNYVPDSVSVLFVASAAYRFDSLYECRGNVGSTIWADECKFVFNNQTSTEQIKTVEHNALVYPNPTSGDVFVKTQIPVKNAKIEILDAKGSIVKMQKFNGTETSLDLRSLKSALYLYRIVEGGKVIESGRINLIK
jgi:hypothetical protein